MAAPLLQTTRPVDIRYRKRSLPWQKRVTYASNGEFGANRLQVTSSRRREGDDELYHHRNNRGPNAAPAKVHSTIVPPYQTATNGKESSVQCSA
jgi:hypothetical protein